MTEHERELIQAVLYAVGEGCFFPVPEPKRGAGILAWKQWGAMRHLHDKIAAYTKSQRTEAA